MEFQEAKDKFIQAWGTLGTDWGVNRTMAQIHALLLISPESLCAEDIMEELKISRGNANMNIRALMSWGLVKKELRPGERKEFFFAEKNMMEVVKKIVSQRKKKELEPMLQALEEVSNSQGESEEAKEFSKVVRDIHLFSQKANSTLDTLIESDANWLIGSFFKTMK
ncbi:MAG: transcriptional regulator [Saprospiraceae bacterium]|nr:transcriptional regulator [Saprospiraceae bacterium]